jgi:hypothetical protein
VTEPYYTDEFVTLYHGDCREILPTTSGSRPTSIVTDPPYGLAGLLVSGVRGPSTCGRIHEWFPCRWA